MIKLDFKDGVGYLKSPLNDGDIIEVCHDKCPKIVRVKVDESNPTACSSCPFSDNAGPCRLLVKLLTIKDACSMFNPCNTKLLDDGKEYKHKFCICYEDISSILEDL